MNQEIVVGQPNLNNEEIGANQRRRILESQSLGMGNKFSTNKTTTS